MKSLISYYTTKICGLLYLKISKLVLIQFLRKIKYMVKTLNADIKVKPHHCENYFDLEDKPSEISKKSFGGGLAMFASQWSKFILQMVSTMILARILRPEDFGLLAMVTVLTNFALMFRDMGLSTATIQKATITHEQVSYLFWINVLTGLIITILLCSISPLLSLFLRNVNQTGG